MTGIRVLALLFAAGTAGFCQAPQNTLTAEEKAAGWRLLFDGKTLSGWEDPSRKTPPGDAWSIENGCLKTASKPRIGEDLFTRELFTDFELLFDWRVSPRGNTGVKYRIQDRFFMPPSPPGARFEDQVALALRSPRLARPETGYEYVVAFEYQLIDDQAAEAANGGKFSPGALYSMVAPSRRAARPVGEFNHSRLVLKGNRVEHWLNGVKVVDTPLDAPEIAQGLARRWGAGSPVYEMLTRQPKKACPLSLQNHNDEAWFRNIRIRPLQ